jgi:DNA-binding NarL/FixJ family response regulator
VPGGDYDLTPREREVLEHLVAGMDFNGIADHLVVSLYTVRAHIRNIYEKLHVHSKSQAVAKALREGLI